MVHILVGICVFCLTMIAAAKEQAVVIVVDPTWDDMAGYLNNVTLLSKFHVVKVNTHLGKTQHAFTKGKLDLYRDITYQSTNQDATLATEQICPQLKSLGVPVAAVIPSSDPTVELADKLSSCMGTRGNPSTGPLAEARRSKWVMGETVRKAGLRSIREKIVSSWSEAEAYLEGLPKTLSKENPVIFKILEGAGGEGVNKIDSMDQAKRVWDSVSGEKNQFGEVNTQILIQEYLKGREYAIDSVSRDGVHKIVTVWFEDFRPANGIFDQYFGFKVLDPADPFTQRLIDYSNKVLDALGLYNGAANTEVKFLEDEDQPCLVEVNARWAGIGWHDGLLVEKVVSGVDQVTATFNAYLDEDAFNAMPAAEPLRQNGAVVFTLNYQPGVLRGLPGVQASEKLKSYLSCDIEEATVGEYIPKTSPNFIPVIIGLAHPDKAVVDADYATLLEIEKTNKFFDVAPNIVGTPNGGRIGLLLSGQIDNRMSLLVLLGLCTAAATVSWAMKPRDEADEIPYIVIE